MALPKLRHDPRKRTAGQWRATGNPPSKPSKVSQNPHLLRGDVWEHCAAAQLQSTFFEKNKNNGKSRKSIKITEVCIILYQIVGKNKKLKEMYLIKVVMVIQLFNIKKNI